MKKIPVILAILFLCTFLVSCDKTTGDVRVWTSGIHTVEGEFVELTENGTIVRIRKTDGKVVNIPLSKLCPEDQEYIKGIENPFEEEDSETSFSALLGPGRVAGERRVLTVDGIEYAFRWCPPGEFMMGAPESEWPDRLSVYPYDETPHKVKLTHGFWLLETEVTQEMWQSVMGENPSEFMGDQNPVENVSWDDSQYFCQILSQKLGQQVRLPTEAQWEYACRAGTTSDYAGDLDSIAWNPSNSGSMTHTVGQKEPNSWGFYDMIGNVWEWCSDYYDSSYYSRSPASDPENTAVSSYRVNRGGSWSSFAGQYRSAFRGGTKPDNQNSHFGLRILLVPSQEE